MTPELKQTFLSFLDKMRVAVETDDREAVQQLIMEGLALIMQIYGQDIPGALPMVIMGQLP